MSPSSLKRLATSLGLSSQDDPAPLRSGWSALPEDIFILLIKSYLGIDSTTSKSLSQTCRAYAAFFLPYKPMRTVCIIEDVLYNLSSRRWHSRVETIQRKLRRSPQLCKTIGTLRIINNRVSDKEPSLHLLFPESATPTLTTWGASGWETLAYLISRRFPSYKIWGYARLMRNQQKTAHDSLIYILSRRYPNLRTFELPRLQTRFRNYKDRHHHWASLSPELQDAVCAFLRRQRALEELSMTNHYPVELVRYCPAITKLEYRICELEATLDFSCVDKGVLRTQRPPTAAQIFLKDLAILDSRANSAATDAIKQFTKPGQSCISLERLEKLTYYGDNKDWSPLPILLNSCASTLLSVNIYVSDRVSAPSLDLSRLRRLQHLTLSSNRRPFGIRDRSLLWIPQTIKRLLLLLEPDTGLIRQRRGVPQLQTLEVVIDTLQETPGKNLCDINANGWIAQTLEAFKQASAASTDGQWSLKVFRIVVCVQKEQVWVGGVHSGRGAKLSRAAQNALVCAVRELVVNQVRKIGVEVRVEVEAVEDTFNRWLRYPSIRLAPFHY